MKKRTFKRLLTAASVAAMSLFYGCVSKQAPLPKPERVDLERFMGRWYVVGYTPIVVDKKAHNAIEHYRLDENAKIQTTYQFRDGSFDGGLKTYTPVGWVHDKTTNAEWRMQFIWPLRSEYIILHVDDDYSETIVVHPNRKYAWIMTRSPDISDERYEAMLQKLVSEGFERSRIQKVAQDWSNEAERLEDMKAQGL
ncbi:MAG: lipocalin family protein [Opitutaceae bacterium]